MEKFEPAYIKTFKKGLLRKKIQAAYKILRSCKLCPRQCRVDRIAGETGICKTAKQAWVSSSNPHFGEEAPLVG
ncbi:MAG: radical SAM protein, partial [Desulfobacterales bacterium]